MATFGFDKVETDCARFRALGADAMADRFLGILWHPRPMRTFIRRDRQGAQLQIILLHV
jgi:hypothetical protein